MVIAVPPSLESALKAQALRRRVAPEALALALLSQELLPAGSPTPVDDWERRLFTSAVDCGVSAPDAALSSDGLYD